MTQLWAAYGAIKEFFINRIFLDPQLHLAAESSQQIKSNYMHSIYQLNLKNI